METLRIVLASLAGLALLAGDAHQAWSRPGASSQDAALPAGEPTGIVSLRDAVSAAWLGNPRLAVFSWEIRRRDAAALQAGLLPNPQLLVELENLAGSGDRAAFEQQETTFWLSQRVPVAGKVAKREHAAVMARDVSAWEYETARLGVRADTTRAFINVLAAQRRVEVLTELERLATNSVTSVRSLLDAGAVSSVATTRAEVERSSVQLRRQRAEGDREAARAALAGAWGSVQPVFTAVSGDLEALEPPPSLADLEARVQRTPQVARFTAERRRRAAALAVEQARRYPDPTLSVGGRHFNDNGDNALVFSVQVPLPVFDRNQGNVLAAARGLSQARAEQASVEVSLRTQLRQRHAAMVAAYRQAETLARETLPTAQRTYEDAQEGRRRGFLRSLDVIDAQRTLFELRLQRIDVLVAYHLARAEVDRLIAAGARDATRATAP